MHQRKESGKVLQWVTDKIVHGHGKRQRRYLLCHDLKTMIIIQNSRSVGDL